MKVVKNTDFFCHFNSAFFHGDRLFIENHIADDVVWTIVGSEPITGKQAFLDAAFGVEDGYRDVDFTIDIAVAANGEAAVKGTMKKKGLADKAKVYAYCDFYVMETESSEKVKELTTFVIELKE
ncbi:nuclear transport factor 2 family protein [Planococcus sp. ISL-110]|uniref:nuclear transport factor 2 family protein n=1 Tax=Planococcus sp. ISL-110 TaxID=2819167 RepID=UPI001BE96BF7|nr:nuclear transport factor 2 family protein [Planococcus sp. ISL-110]MBT2570808.1 nuclear transport factor 2 family protein [Planococcus sp. ISL-110]